MVFQFKKQIYAGSPADSPKLYPLNVGTVGWLGQFRGSLAVKVLSLVHELVFRAHSLW